MFTILEIMILDSCCNNCSITLALFSGGIAAAGLLFTAGAVLLLVKKRMPEKREEDIIERLHSPNGENQLRRDLIIEKISSTYQLYLNYLILLFLCSSLFALFNFFRCELFILEISFIFFFIALMMFIVLVTKSILLHL